MCAYEACPLKWPNADGEPHCVGLRRDGIAWLLYDLDKEYKVTEEQLRCAYLQSMDNKCVVTLCVRHHKQGPRDGTEPESKLLEIMAGAGKNKIEEYGCAKVVDMPLPESDDEDEKANKHHDRDEYLNDFDPGADLSLLLSDEVKGCTAKFSGERGGSRPMKGALRNSKFLGLITKEKRFVAHYVPTELFSTHTV